MTDDSSQEEKQNFLRENILEKGYDTNMFVDFLIGKKGEDGADVGNWSMSDLQIVVKEFISMQSNIYNPPKETPVIPNIEVSPPVNNDPLTTAPKIQVQSDPLQIQKLKSQNDPLQRPKIKNQNDPLQNKKPQSKKNIKYDPLSGGIPQQNDNHNKQINSFTNNNNQIQNNNINTNLTPQLQPQFQQNIINQTQSKMQVNIQPQFQNQFQQQYFNQFLQQNQLNQQFQPQLFQGQFPQMSNQNQIQQQNNIQNNLQNPPQNITPETKTQIPKPPVLPQKTEKNNEPEKKISPPPKIQAGAGSVNSKDDIGILYGIITLPTEDCKYAEKTPLGTAVNPNIQVGFPEKVEGGFFSKSYVTYLITTSPLNIKVRRRYSDFQWLRQIMNNLYVGNVIPTTPRKNKIGSDKFGDAFLQKRMRTLEKFLNNLLLNPIIKFSQLLYDFISIENEADFNKKKKEYEKMKPPQNLNEYQSLMGRVNIEVKKEKETYFDNIKENISLNEALFTKLNENIKLLKIQIENVTLKIDEIAQNWSELCKTSTKYFDGDDIIQTYDNMSKLFTNWSDALKRHNNVVFIDIREYFKYVKNTFKSMKELVTIVDSNKNTFNKNEKYLINKKDDLFRKGDVSKWELDSNDKDNANKLLQDKNNALKKIIPKETNNVINLKKIYGYFLNRIIDEYERIRSINSSYHKQNLLNTCTKLTEIYDDFQKGSAEIVSIINSKDKTNPNNSNVK